MTVSSELNRKQYTGDGVTTSFATSPVVFFETSDLVVYAVTTATGASTTLTENTHYTVSGGSGSTGTVNLAGGSSPYGAPSASQTLVIVRDVPLTQEVDLVQNDASDAEVMEDSLDKLTMISQQLSARLDRSFVLADSDVSGVSVEIPTPTASRVLGWNSDGDGLTNYSASSLGAEVLTTAFTESLLDDEDAETFVQTIVDDMTAETSPASGDIILISDVSLTPDKARKMTLANALKVINDLTADSSPNSAADYVVTYDADAAAAKKVLLGGVSNGAYRSVQVFTSSGTWTKPSGLKRARVTVVGGGGGGGGVSAVANAVAGGGGSGGMAVLTIAAGSLGATETVTVGAGGAAGADTGGNGGSGGASSFGAHCSATGGSGGGGSTSGASGYGGAGSGSSGDTNASGNPGLVGVSTQAHGGTGGSSPVGGGAGGAGLGAAGSAGTRGGGGGGAGSSGSAHAGGAGGAGIIIVEEFF